VQEGVGADTEVSVVDCASQIGSGALPVDTLPSAGLRLTPTLRRGVGVQALATAFRQLPVPVIGRIHDDALWLDLRCLPETHEAEFTAQLAQLQTLRDTP
jgi:L-seryl-tRNA(Ser) seleniumtransferase